MSDRQDEDLSAFLAMVDERFRGLYRDVADEIDKDERRIYGKGYVRAASDDYPCVCIALWKRQDSGIEAVHKLAHEAKRVFVWHNGGFNLPDFGSNVEVVRSPRNAGPIARFLLALGSGFRNVIYWDDDMIPEPGYYAEYCKHLHRVNRGEIVAQHAMHGRTWATRSTCRVDGEECDYVGMGGTICKTVYAAAPKIWENRFCHMVADDVAMCLGAKELYGARLTGMPSLKSTFTWKNEADENSVYKTQTELRAKAYDDLFLKTKSTA